MKILLTGPTGFIGSSFLRLALGRGHQVAGLIIPSETVPSEFNAEKNVVWLRGTLDQAPWEEIAGFQADVCIHTAWITTPGTYLESPENERFRDASLVFLRKVRELGTGYIISFGTCIEYQVTGQPLSEDTSPVAPATTYSRCKNELRLALETEMRADGTMFCWTRVFYPYGPREHPSRLCSSIIQKLLRDETITLRTPTSTKDYIFISDLAGALMTVMESRFSGIINLGTGIGLSVREIAQTLGVMLAKSERIREMDPPEIDPLGYVVADASKLHQLGWRPEHDLKQGLHKLIASLKV